jgi:hypothetical protein
MVLHVNFPLFNASSVCLLGAQQNGDVLLGDSTEPLKGRVAVFLDGHWGTVRFNHGSSQLGVAQAVCRQLGYYDVIEVNTVSNMG